MPAATVNATRGLRKQMAPKPTAATNAEYICSESRGIYVISSDGETIGSDPGTLERRQHNRQSWLNMRRKGEESAPAAVTPSPQTTRSYVSGISTGLLGSDGASGGTEGTASGRTTVTSGHMSGSGANTITGSNHTLNDIISDYHSQSHAGDYHQYQHSNSTSTDITATLANATTTSSTTTSPLQNGSTVKLLPAAYDEKNQQTKCSVFRGLVLCVCLNVTYANIVRFPRELDRYGTTYLIPYCILLFLVGLPIILLEVSVGQFLGQGAAHTWRASPIFKGACIISRFASWLATVWVSVQSVLALAYVAMFLFNTLPFRECVGSIRMSSNGYMVNGNNGQDCLQKTFLTPFWENPLYFGLLSIGLIGIWILVMLCTHNSRILRRNLFCLGLVGFTLLCMLAGREIYEAVQHAYFPQLLPFAPTALYESNIWFNALMQVIFATNGGFGALPMLTGKFLYKGDAVLTSIVYLFFSLLVNALAVTLFLAQYAKSATVSNMIDELKPLTTIYDRILYGELHNELLTRLLPALTYALIIIASIISISLAIYTCTRLVPRHPNYIICLLALVTGIISLTVSRYTVTRLLDARVVGTLVITALVFELIAITWIYGAKNIYTDLEFSIGRPISKFWMFLWCICPSLLTGILVWWCSDDDQYDLLADYVPRWAPILFALALIFLIACVQIFRQVEYNFFGMICEAAKPAKEWGPADPLARHAWKQWRSVCQGTDRRDFTLRRRGTRDYTHSIKKGQYSTANKSAHGQTLQQQQQQQQQQQHIHQTNWKSSTSGNSSPNYSGSIFGSISGIEKDISVDKFAGITPQFVPFEINGSGAGKPLRYSHRMQQPQRTGGQQLAQPQQPVVHTLPSSTPTTQSQPYHSTPAVGGDKHREVVYIRRLSDDGQHATRIEITPSNESITYGGSRNPLGRPGQQPNGGGAYVKRSASSGIVEQQRGSVISVGGDSGARLPHNGHAMGGSGDHICWRKFAVNGQEFSTEL